MYKIINTFTSTKQYTYEIYHNPDLNKPLVIHVHKYYKLAGPKLYSDQIYSKTKILTKI